MIGRRTSYLDDPADDARDAIAGLRARQRRQRARLPDRARRPVVEGQVGRDVQPGRPVAGHARRDRRRAATWACGWTSTGCGGRPATPRRWSSTRTSIVHYLSQFMVLEPGDLINTGTPPGVGMGFKPPVWLQPGDVMELGIDGLGTQRQQVVGPPVTRCARSSSPAPARPRCTTSTPPVAGPGEVVVDVDARRRLRHRRGVLHRRDGRTCTPAQAAYPMRHRPRVVRHGVARSATASTRPGSAAGSPATPCSAAGTAAAARPGGSTCAPTGTRSASAAAGRARSPSSSPVPVTRPARAARHRRRRRSARWSSRAATRCARSGPPASRPASGCWSLGPGTIGLLVAQFAAAAGRRGAPARAVAASLDFARSPRLRATPGPPTTCRTLPFDAVIDASNAAALPGAAPSSWSSPAAGSSTSASPASPAWSTPAASRSRTSPRSAS